MALEWEVVKEGRACQLYADASAALKAVRKVLAYQKIRGEDNPADGLTKHVRQELAQQFARATCTRLGSD